MGAPLLLVGASAGRLLPKAGAVDGRREGGVRRDDARRRGVDAGAHPARARSRSRCGPSLAFVAGYCLFTHGRPRREARGAVVRRGLGVLALSTACSMLVGALAGAQRPAAAARRASGAPRRCARGEHRLALQAHQVGRGPRPGTRGGQGRGPAADARLLCGLVRVLQGDGGPDVHRSGRAGGARATRSCCRPTSRPTTTTTRRCSQRFGILGPPTIVFFAADGTERTDFRVVGFQPADGFPRARGAGVRRERRVKPLDDASSLVTGAAAAGAAGYLVYQQRAGVADAPQARGAGRGTARRLRGLAARIPRSSSPIADGTCARWPTGRASR